MGPETIELILKIQVYICTCTQAQGNNMSGIFSYNLMQMWAWWRHQMETFSALLASCAENSPVTGEFPAKRPVTRSFDGFFVLPLNELLSKH